MSNPTNTGAPSYVTQPARQVQSFPATVNVADPAGLVDLNISQLSIDASGRLRTVLSGPAPAGVVGTQPSQLADSVENAARVVAPGAGVAIVTLVAPAAGTYEVDVVVGYDADVPAAAELNNMEVQRGGVALFTPLQVLSVINNLQAKRFRITFTGANNLTVNAIGAGTALVGYTAAIVATRVA